MKNLRIAKHLFTVLIFIFAAISDTKYIKSYRKNLKTVPALLLTTVDSISLIYPEELNYAQDFLQTIYKIIMPEQSLDHQDMYRIEDVVYDNQTSSVYFIVSNLFSGSEIIQLTHKPSGRFYQNPHHTTYEQNTNYRMASNWIRKVIYKNSTAKLLSLDLNVKKRKLYWFEFNKLSQKWSIGTRRLNKQRYPTNYFTFENPFANDGYTFISVAVDNGKNDASLFITNNQTLNLCFLANKTCINYFDAPKEQKQQKINDSAEVLSFKKKTPIQNKNISNNNNNNDSKAASLDETVYDSNYDDYYEFDEYLIGNSKEKTNLIESLSGSVAKEDVQNNQAASGKKLENTPIYKFGRLMGIKYEPINHSLYLNDYGFDRIERITFEKKGSFKFKLIESILKSEYDKKTLINPLMSVIYENFIFWIDIEKGLRSTVYKSTCLRTVYKIKDTTALKLIDIWTESDDDDDEDKKLARLDDSQQTKDPINNMNKIVLIKELDNSYKKKLRYPPNYFSSRRKSEENQDLDKYPNDYFQLQRSNNLVSSAVNLYFKNLTQILILEIFILKLLSSLK